MYPALDSAERLVQYTGDLVVFVPIEVQKKRRFENFWQLLNGLLNFFNAQVGFRTIAHCRLLRIQQEIIRCIVKNGFLLGLPAVIINKNITHDSEEPCLDIGSIVILLLVS